MSTEDFLEALERGVKAMSEPEPPRVLYMPDWAYPLAMADLAAQGLPETLEQLEAEAAKIIGPCTIKLVSDR